MTSAYALDVMLKKLTAIILLLLASSAGCSERGTSIEGQLLQNFRTALTEGSVALEESATFNVTIIGLSRTNEEKIRKDFFRPRKDDRILLVDVTYIEDHEPFRTIDGKEFASEAKFEIIEWIDERTVIISTSSHFNPIFGGGGTTKLQHNGEQWELVEVIKQFES